jgi:hypothetical protein
VQSEVEVALLLTRPIEPTAPRTEQPPYTSTSEPTTA